MNYQLIVPDKKYYNYNLSAVERVLTNRGIELSDIPHYLNTTNNDILPPSSIANMKEGAKMLIKHISANNPIFIQIDSDADGYTSSAVLINYLNYLFPFFVQNNISYRLHNGKEHGVIVNTVPEGTKLVIIPDAGSNQYEEHKQLQEKGIDVLVIDHHESDQISPYACIINNQLCDYPTKSLSGVGMVYKFCSYIDELLNVDYADRLLDLVALGLISDVMDLRYIETRHLISLGLEQIRNPFFKTMVDKQQYSLRDGITPFGIAFYITPYVNATIRMGSQEEKLLLFESMLETRAYELIPSTKRGCKGQMETKVEQACRNCNNLKNHQTKARDAGMEVIERLIEENDLLKNKMLIIQLEPQYSVDKNLTGLIANQLMSKYQRPILLLNKRTTEHIYQEQDGTDISYTEITWEGSCRNYDKSSFTHLKDFLSQSGLVMYAEGHQNALGTGIRDEVMEYFINYSNRQLADCDFTPCYKVDFIFDSGNFNGEDIIEIANLKSLWGQGVEEPYIAFEHVKVTKDNLTLMSKDKNPTLKITLPNGTSLIKFKSSEEEYQSLIADSDLGCRVITVVGRCEQNVWNGGTKPQIIVEDYEITGEMKYYF